VGAPLTGCLFDTNILIYWWADEIPPDQVPRIEHLLKTSFNISIITRIEFLGFPGFSGDLKQKARDFLSYAVVLPLTPEVAERTILLREKHSIKVPDAIIAATALTYDLTLITRNASDFKDIPELTIENPFA